MSKKIFDKIIDISRIINVFSMFMLPLVVLTLTKNQDLACLFVMSPFLVEAVIIRPIEDDYYLKKKGGCDESK